MSAPRPLAGFPFARAPGSAGAPEPGTAGGPPAALTLDRPPVFAFLIVLLLLLSAPAARAQSAQASLFGRVTNQATGAPIPRALVIQRSTQTGTQSYRFTNEQGFYSFPALMPGTYSVRADAPPAHLPEERTAVELPVASRIELNFALRPKDTAGAPPAPVTAPRVPPAGSGRTVVPAFLYGPDAAVPQAVMIALPVQATETLTAALSSLIDERKLLELALSGRDVYTLLVLQPGVTSDNATARGLGFSVSGQRVASSNFLLDGVDNNDLLVTGPATRVSADAVKEYRMTTNNFTAEFGRAAGFIANAVTRSGSNELHGTLYEFFNHDRLNANSFTNNWQDIGRPPYRQHQFGGSLGGPLRRDKLFFFANAERFRSSSESAPRVVYLPSPSFIAGLPEGSLARKVLTQFTPPAGNPIPGIPFAVEQQYVLPFVQRNTFVLGRLDAPLRGGTHRLSGRYSLSQQTADDFAFSVYPGLNEPLVIRGQNISANYTADVGGGANEAKFGLSRSTVRALRPHSDIPTMASAEGVALPGSESAYDYSFGDTLFHASDNYTRLTGRHTLGMGGEWRHVRHDSLLSPGRDGWFTFDSIFDFRRDAPSWLFISVNRQTGLPGGDEDYRRRYRQNEFAGFLQDTVKLTGRLTVNAGVRYEYFGPPAALGGTRDFNFVFATGNTIGERLASSSLREAELYKPDRNNFAGRLGFAYDLTGSGRTVVRGAYGIFFDRPFNNLWMDARNNSIALQYLLNFPGRPPEFTYTFPARDGVKGGIPAVAAATVAVDQGLRTPYAQSWFAGLQREVTRNLLVDLNHAGSLARKLITADVINRPSSVATDPNSNPNGRFNPSQPNISYRANQGHSDYLSFRAAVTRRWSRGVQFQASYTYSRSQDVQSDPYARRASADQDRAKKLADSSFFQVASGFSRQFDPSGDYGYSDFDQRHNLVFNVIAESPRMPGWKQLFSRWQATMLAGFRSGFPFSVEYSPDEVADTGGVFFVKRADFSGSSAADAFLDQRPELNGGVRILDKSQFRLAPSGKPGNTRRNAFHGPGFWNADVSVSRRFALGERGALQLRAEFFNVFNHTNLNSPDPVLTSFSFGEASFGRQGFGSALPSVSPLNEQPRRIQVALKLHF